MGYKSRYTGVGELLRSDMVLEALAIKAEKVRAYAEDLAPESPLGSELSPPGKYKKSFKVVLDRRGGIHFNRAVAYIVNDDPIAEYVEHGTRNMRGLHVLIRSLMEALRA